MTLGPYPREFSTVGRYHQIDLVNLADGRVGWFVPRIAVKVALNEIADLRNKVQKQEKNYAALNAETAELRLKLYKINIAVNGEDEHVDDAEYTVVDSGDDDA